MVFWLTFAACSKIFLESSIRPLLISQRGDSGKHLKKKMRETDNILKPNYQCGPAKVMMMMMIICLLFM